MWVSCLKLLLSITFISVVADDEIDIEDIRNCSHIHGRLPTNVQPLVYTTQLDIRPDLEYIFGNTDIAIQVQEEILRVVLHARNIRINSTCTAIIAVNEATVRLLPKCGYIDDRLLEVVHCTADDIVFLIFDTLTIPGGYFLHIEHTSPYDKNLDRLNYTYGRAGRQDK